MDKAGHHRAARRSLEIIEAVAASGQPLSLAELARRVDLPKSTAHSLVQTLAADGFLERGLEDGHYGLGPRLLRLLGRLPDQYELPRVARPMMETLVARVDETAILGVRQGMSIVYVEQVESRQYIRYAAMLGTPRPLYASSIGKLFTAAMAVDDLRDLLREVPPQQLTERTKADPEAVIAESREVAARRYAINEGETIEGVLAVAAPVYRGAEADGLLLGGLSVAGPADRMVGRLDEIRPYVIETAQQIGLAVKLRR